MDNMSPVWAACLAMYVLETYELHRGILLQIAYITIQHCYLC